MPYTGQFEGMSRQIYYSVGDVWHKVVGGGQGHNRLQEAAPWVLLSVCLVWGFLPMMLFKSKRNGVPRHSNGWRFEPGLISQTRFINNARSIISSGYAKFRHTPFIVSRYDVDIMVLPHKHLEELRIVPPSKLSGSRAQIGVCAIFHANLVHKWTNTTIMVESDLHFRVLQNKLAAELYKYLDLAYKEADYGWEQDVPQSTDWIEVDIQDVMRKVVARMTARIFLGTPVCRDEEWLKLVIDFPMDTFTAAFTLRRFPPWMHFAVAPFIPARYRMKAKTARALQILTPTMNRYLKDPATPDDKTAPNEDDPLIKWMIEHGTDKENQPWAIAARQCILSLASIHTTSMTVANVLFDLCDKTEWFPVLREEIVETTRDLGALRYCASSKQWLSMLEKMDSFIVECQRLSPPILLAPQREAMVPMTLRDGTFIPAGTRVSWAANCHLNDPEVTPNPENFDPLRSYRVRHSAADEKNKHQAGQTSVDNLTYGYGKLACPGRMFAVGEIKSLLSRLLMEFEFKFPEGKGRPDSMYADENVFPDPAARLLMRKRR